MTDPSAALKSKQPPRDAGMSELYDLMEQHSLAPLWDIYANLVTREPTASEPSVIWKWQDYLPVVERSADAVQGELADHRVLLLKNPDSGARMYTTTNLIAGIQCVMPGEKTVEHRHTASACRLVLEGTGGSTFVDGKRCRMHTGDFIITPNWTWHGHENDSETRAVWLDMLDVPLTRMLDATFGGPGPAESYPEHVSTLPDDAFAGGFLPRSDRPAVPYSPRFRYAWEDAVKAIGNVPDGADGARWLRYANPLDGGAVMATMDACLVEIEGGRTTRATRSTANGLCVVLEGEGESRVGGTAHSWTSRDIFTLPHWQWISHTVASERARLLVVSDREALRRLGFLREELES